MKRLPPQRASQLFYSAVVAWIALLPMVQPLKAEPVASEKSGIINPIDLTFDDAGRLWTQPAEMYPLDPMGNTQIFIPRSDVKSQAGVPGKSFMKAMLSGIPEQTMVDLLSYIKTLK